ARDAGPPWPGRLPAPSPSRVPTRPLPAEVLDDAGRAVGVSGRGQLTGVPHRIAMDAPARTTSPDVPPIVRCPRSRLP
ncbi:MAG: hypothetical protein ACRDSM_05900, partial [Pseudonocardiaceae bacterium]